LQPNAKYFVYKKQVEQYLMPFNDGLPSMADLLPDFAAGENARERSELTSVPICVFRVEAQSARFRHLGF
jgi:hypothetical protein